MRNILWRLVIAIALVVIASCHNKENKSNGKAPGAISYLEGYIVKAKVLDQTILISGSLKPFEETVLMPEVAGRVIKINLPEGSFVKEGTLLVKLFDEDLQAQLHKTKNQLEISEQTQKRQSELLKVNGISQTDYDQSLLQVNSIKADIEVLRVQIRKTEVLAPFDGVIGLRNISLGAEVNVSTALATIRAVKKLKIDFNVPEKYSTEVKAGTKIQFTVQGKDKKFDAVVIATEEGIDLSTRNLKARAVVADNTSSLVPGSFANVVLRLNEDKSALLIPTQAVIPRESSKQVIVCKSGKAKFMTVKTGVRQAAAIEVLSGIEPGDTVVTTGILFIKPGSELRFSKINK